MAFNVISAARLPLLPRARPGPLTLTSLRLPVMLPTVQSLPRRAFDAGLRPRPFQTKQPACYRVSWQLPGLDFRRQATTSLRTRSSAMAPFCSAHEHQRPTNPASLPRETRAPDRIKGVISGRPRRSAASCPPIP